MIAQSKKQNKLNQMSSLNSFLPNKYFSSLRGPAANLLLKQGYKLGNTASSTKFSSRKNIIFEIVVTYIIFHLEIFLTH